jgi:AraC family transcriptional regulator
MEPKIEILQKKLLVGKWMNMSLSKNKTFDLWKSFMSQKKEIRNTVSQDLYSMQIYDPSLNFNDFTPETEFVKWAAVEVSNACTIPDGMDIHELQGGLYAVFRHVGPASEFQKTFRRIFQQWLPASDYETDQREHFELLGEKYKNNEPDSEEEVWVPIRKKNQAKKP